MNIEPVPFTESPSCMLVACGSSHTKINWFIYLQVETRTVYIMARERQSHEFCYALSARKFLGRKYTFDYHQESYTFESRRMSLSRKEFVSLQQACEHLPNALFVWKKDITEKLK